MATVRGSAVGDRAGGARRNSGWPGHMFGDSRGQLGSTCSGCLCQGHYNKYTYYSPNYFYEYYYDYYDDYDYYDHIYDYYGHIYYYYCYYY